MLTKLSKQYNVPMRLLHQFINIGLLDDLKYDKESKSFSIDAIKRLESCICLHGIGLDVKTIHKLNLLKIANEDTRKERIDILQKHRAKNLENIHMNKKKLDCIDCILYEIENDSEYK